MEPRGVSEDNQVNSHPSSSSSSNEVVVNNVEQRSADNTPSSRIPSHVFDTTNTKSATEWSVASNESLFSIHMENMSFNDNLSWMSKSGELAGPATIASPLFEIPVDKPSTPTEVGKLKSDGGGHDEDDVAIKIMREVLRENESQKKNDVDKEPDNLVRTMSQPSDTSCQSFAFPMLATETDKNNSNKSDAKNKIQPSSQNSATATTPQHTPPETPKPLRVPDTPKAEAPNKSSTPKATQNGGPKRWFSCFSCFSSCS